MNSLPCQSKRGVMTLRLCDEPSVATCSQCQRPVCRLHLADPALSLCAACAVLASTSKKKPSGPPANPDWTRDNRYDAGIGWAYLYSNWYFNCHATDLAYHDDDARSFATRDDGDFGSEKDPSIGFLDS